MITLHALRPGQGAALRPLAADTLLEHELHTIPEVGIIRGRDSILDGPALELLGITQFDGRDDSLGAVGHLEAVCDRRVEPALLPVLILAADHAL